MIKAAGALYFCIETNRIFLIQRSRESSHPFKWGFVGGKIESDENILEGLTREIKEELNIFPEYHKIYPMDQFVSKDKNFIYSSFIIIVKQEFLPYPNDEVSGFMWCNIHNPPKPLHPGTYKCISNKCLINSLDSLSEGYKMQVSEN